MRVRWLRRRHVRSRLSIVRDVSSLPKSTNHLRWVLLPVVVALLLTACSSGPKRPVFYPNARLQDVGQAQAERDVDRCMALADNHGVSRTKDGQVGRRAAEAGIIGGVAAGAWGAIRDKDDVGERAAAGAAAGAATGATRGAFKSTELSPTFRKFVERCLRERGYDVIGWE